MRSTPPAVSLCIPTFNGRRYVGEALASALGQTFDDHELLIVDDASTDGTLDVVGSFADARVTVHRNRSRLGIPGNWNECLRRARGRYVKFLFQDDTLFPKALETLVSALERHPEAAISFGRRQLMFESGQQVLGKAYVQAVEEFHARASTTVCGSDLVDAALRRGQDLTLNVVGEPSFVLLQREAAVRAGGFDAAFRQVGDWEMWLRLARNAPLAFVDEPLGRLRVHSGSQSAANFRTLGVRRELLRFLDHVETLYGAVLSVEAQRALRRLRRRHRLRLAAAQVFRI